PDGGRGYRRVASQPRAAPALNTRPAHSSQSGRGARRGSLCRRIHRRARRVAAHRRSRGRAPAAMDCDIGDLDRGTPRPLGLRRGFARTIAVMQTEEAVERGAYEWGEDLARDGIVYAEVRYAPVFHTARGLNHEQVVQAVEKGFERAERERGVTLRQIICAMRDRTDSLEMAELAVANRERGVVGFDIAGEEAGHPPKAHIEAFQLCRRENFSITIHAGEAFGPPSIWQALQYCGAHRIGHGVRLVEDMAISEGRVVKLGPLAAYVRDKRIPLELCPSSNVDTGAVPTLAEHPIRHFLAQS